MDLETLRAKVAEHRANAVRIAKEETAARESLAAISEAVKGAEKYANEKSILAVIDTSSAAQAKAEEAKANLTAAFERETEIRDRLPRLSAARQKLDEEITSLLRDIKIAENAKVADALTPTFDQIDNEIVSVTGRLLAWAKASGMMGWEILDLVKDRINGSSDAKRASLKERIVAEAEKVRAEITSGRA